MKVRRTGRILQEIIQTLKEHQEELRETYRVKHLKIFGSYVRNDQKEDSDLDLMVSFEETPTLLEFIEKPRAKTPLFKAEIQPDTPKGC